MSNGQELSLEELLVNGAATLGVELDKNKASLYLKYMGFLLAWNEKFNLTAIREPREIVIKHFLDSISALPYLQSNSNLRLIDIGSGAGFPGVPLKIANPGLDVVMLDSLSKRVSFLNSLTNELNLKGISAVHGRAEEFGRMETFREGFDIAVSRAVAGLSVLAELCIPFVRVSGIFLAYKGPGAGEEVERGEHAVITLGGRIAREIEVELPGSAEKRVLVVINKESNTPEKYPRKAGIPEKRPL